MKLILSKNKTIHDIQSVFNKEYPFLKLEFYKPANGSFVPEKKHLPHSALLEAAGLKKAGEIEVYKEMTVEELENYFQFHFGMNAQVSRKSGVLWLETTMTDKWSLYKQNEHGRQISLSEDTSVTNNSE